MAIGGGAVTVTSTGNITTTGDLARGIYAQRPRCAVTVTSTGNITTTGPAAFGIRCQQQQWPGDGDLDRQYHDYGNYAYGICAISAGGGAVKVTSTGNITTAGNDAEGIFAVSFGGRSR